MGNERWNSRVTFDGAARRRFYAIWKKKTSGAGADIRPPPVGARVNLKPYLPPTTPTC